MSKAKPLRPKAALSLRQPWAWLVVNGFKDIENRKWATNFRGPILIHSAKGMTLEEYSACERFCEKVWRGRRGLFVLPPFETLQRGGIVGQVTIVDCVNSHVSPWFTGPYGFVVTDPKIIEFERTRGRLGIFQIKEASCR